MTTDDGEPMPDHGHTEPAGVVQVTGPLPERLAQAVEELAARAAAADGVAPLDDDARLGLRLPQTEAHRPARRHLLAGRPAPDGEPAGPDEELTGYAQLEPATAQVALFVAPAARRAGIGSAVLAAATAALDADAPDPGSPDPGSPDPGSPDPGSPVPARALTGWAHGDLPAATAFARHHGLVAARRLFQLRRDLTNDSGATSSPATPPAGTPPAGTPPAGMAMPPGYRLRAFVPGQDDAGWVALNAAAFVHLPDQGGLTLADLSARMREPWFDPAGLLLAETLDGELAGFHWTKVHDSTEDDPTPAGEVYVLGVHPGHQRTGLGRALLAAGLEHLRGRGVSRVLLYVDAANTAALRLYERLGFAVHRTDTLYSSPPGATVSPS